MTKREAVKEARRYLKHEPCYRVELMQPYDTYDRVNWPEADSEEEARSMFRGVLYCRKATVEEDLYEFATALQKSF